MAAKKKTVKKAAKKTPKKAAPAVASHKPARAVASHKPARAVASHKPARAVIAKQWDTTEAELTAILDKDLMDAWKKLRAFAAGLGPQNIYPAAQSIMFARKFCYFYARPKKKSIEVWIFLPRAIEGLQFTASSGKKTKYSNLYKVTHIDQVEEPLTDWLREAYDYAPALE